MAVEDVVGLQVMDEVLYAKYREGMLPILKKMGGYFRYDAHIQQELKSPANHPINRIFIIGFPNARIRDSFFSDPDYLAVRKEFFDRAVASVCRLSQYSIEEAPGL